MPLAVYARMESEDLAVDGLVGTTDGTQILRSQRRGKPGFAEQMAGELAEDLLRQGADQIIADVARLPTRGSTASSEQ